MHFNGSKLLHSGVSTWPVEEKAYATVMENCMLRRSELRNNSIPRSIQIYMYGLKSRVFKVGFQLAIRKGHASLIFWEL